MRLLLFVTLGKQSSFLIKCRCIFARTYFKIFLDFVQLVDSSICNCKPDCNSTEYSVTTSSAPFRKCDSKNLNISPLCSLDSTMKPTLWQREVVDSYNVSAGNIPDYIKVD